MPYRSRRATTIFGGYTPGDDNTPVAPPRTLGGLVFEEDGGSETHIKAKSFYNLTVGTGNVLVMNANGSMSATYVEIHSSSLSDNFKLVSMMIESFSGGWTDEFTITRNDGGSGTSADACDTINLATPASSGSITYVKDPSTVSGTLSFGCDWQNIDTIRRYSGDLICANCRSLAAFGVVGVLTKPGMRL